MSDTRRRPRSYAAVPLRLMVAVLLGWLGAVAAPGAARADEPPPPQPPIDGGVPTDQDVLGTPLVLVGMGGLGWDDVTPALTPTLWSLLEDGAAAAAVTVQTVGQPACPAGGWLSLSAGRAATSARLFGSCLSLPPVDPQGAGASVGGWQQLAEDQERTTYGAEPGTLAGALADAGVCATAVGPGAAVALADPTGSVSRYRPRVGDDTFDCPVTVVDAGRVLLVEGLSGRPLPIDTRVAAVLDAVPADATVLLTSVSGSVGKRPEMGVAVAYGPRVGADLLTTPSTRRSGVIRLLDVPSSLVRAVGGEAVAEFQGSAIVADGPRDDAAATAERLAEISVADRGLRAATSPLLDAVGLATLLLIGGCLIVARRGTPSRRPVRPLRSAAEVAFLVLAAAPVASYLVTLVQWWRVSRPVLLLWCGMAAIAVLLGVAAYLLPRRPLWWAALGITAVTTAVLLVDGVTGSTLHWGSPLGTSPVIGNRYYGFGNSTYGVLAVHSLVLAGALAGHFLSAGRRRAAVVAVVVVGTLAVVVDIWPTWGADVGGGLALLPAFGVLALGVAERRITAARIVTVVGGAVVVVAVVALLDWSRPPARRSHAGQFVQQVIDGDAVDLLTRKVQYAVLSVGRGPSAWLTLVALAVAAVVVIRPDRLSPRSLGRAVERWPGLRACLAALLVSAVLGSLVNDWGIRVATVVLTAALPLLGVVCVRASAPSAEPVAPARAPELSGGRAGRHRG